MTSKQTDPHQKPTLWKRIWKRPASRWLLGIPLGAYIMFMLGAAAVVGSEVAIYATGTEQFCTSACHSMERFTAPEWRDSPHNSSPSGVRATCSDCHIPHIYPQKLLVKTKAGIKDAYHELMGTISTAEKYEAHRARMAEQVWAYMIETDSRECRHCHSEDHFDLGKQQEEAIRAHLEGVATGKTCIECHKGIAHKTPDEVQEELVSGSVPE
jgi:nitrate/TMAO reductase-like tetraheme cytochrome c subunit